MLTSYNWRGAIARALLLLALLGLVASAASAIHPIRARRLGGNAYPNIGAQFVSASSQYASIADNASISISATLQDLTIAGWFYVEISPAATGVFAGQYSPTGNQRGIYIGVNGARQLFCQASSNGTAITSFTGTDAAPLREWRFFVLRHDSVADTISLQMGLGTPDVTAYSAGLFDNTAQFRLGALGNDTFFLDGRLDAVGYWKTAAGGGGVLTDDQVRRLYNNGFGRAYRDLDESLKVGLVSWFDLDGTFNDRHGTNHLTPINGPAFSGGKR